MRVSIGRTRDFSAALRDEETWGDDVVANWKTDLAGMLCQMTSPPVCPALSPGTLLSSPPDSSPARLVGTRREELNQFQSPP